MKISTKYIYPISKIFKNKCQEINGKMVNGVFDEDAANAKKILEQDGLESSEEGFMQGYSSDDEVEECSECGSAIEEDGRVTKEVDGELQKFCSKNCLEEFEENL